MKKIIENRLIRVKISKFNEKMIKSWLKMIGINLNLIFLIIGLINITLKDIKNTNKILITIIKYMDNSCKNWIAGGSVNPNLECSNNVEIMVSNNNNNPKGIKIL